MGKCLWFWAVMLRKSMLWGFSLSCGGLVCWSSLHCSCLVSWLRLLNSHGFIFDWFLNLLSDESCCVLCRFLDCNSRVLDKLCWLLSDESCHIFFISLSGGLVFLWLCYKSCGILLWFCFNSESWVILCLNLYSWVFLRLSLNCSCCIFLWLSLSCRSSILLWLSLNCSSSVFLWLLSNSNILNCFFDESLIYWLSLLS